MMLMSWVELHSIFVDEKDERAYVDPDDTIFNAPSGDSLFPDAHLPLLDSMVSIFLLDREDHLLRTGHRRPIHSWHCY